MRSATAFVLFGLLAAVPAAARTLYHDSRNADGPEATPAPAQQPTVGYASWYGIGDGSSHRTASGAPFNPQALGLAHASWPFGMRVRVTVVSTGRSAVLTVLDRTGPGVRRHGRTFDLYYGAARSLGILDQGAALVQAEPVEDEQVAEYVPPLPPRRHHLRHR